jgi:hypothetical protein
VGELAGTPAGHAHGFAGSVVVVDLPGRPRSRPLVRGWFRVPAVRPGRRTPATDALDAAATRVVGQSAHTWLSRTGARRYLPDLVAEAFRDATGADAALVLASQHHAQAPLDGAVAALRVGPVTELDLMSLFPYTDDRPAVVELRSGELAAVVAAHDATSDPRARNADQVWWNWCRMPAGKSAAVEEPGTLAVISWVVPRLAELLQREPASQPATSGARAALLAALG